VQLGISVPWHWSFSEVKLVSSKFSLVSSGISLNFQWDSTEFSSGTWVTGNQWPFTGSCSECSPGDRGKIIHHRECYVLRILKQYFLSDIAGTRGKFLLRTIKNYILSRFIILRIDCPWNRTSSKETIKIRVKPSVNTATYKVGVQDVEKRHRDSLNSFWLACETLDGQCMVGCSFYLFDLVFVPSGDPSYSHIKRRTFTLPCLGLSTSIRRPSFRSASSLLLLRIRSGKWGYV